jgi:hypothetical protein
MKYASWPVSRVLYALPRDDHSSGAFVAERLKQPTRTTGAETRLGPKPRAVPIRSCSRWGLPCRSRHRSRGGLLPHPFTLTARGAAVCFLWHFPWGRPRRTLSGTVLPWSPDFPLRRPFDRCRSGRPASWRGRNVASAADRVKLQAGRRSASIRSQATLSAARRRLATTTNSGGTPRAIIRSGWFSATCSR